MWGCLGAEIHQVIISWTPGLCLESCVRGLDAYFLKVPSVESVTISQPGARAVIKVKPKMKFDYVGLRSAMQMIGLSITEIRVNVTGNIVQEGTKFVMVSSGDLSRFILINPVVPGRGYSEQFNLANRQLSPDMRDKLLKGIQDKEMATVDGPLFMPELYQPLNMVIEQIRFNKPEEKNR